MKKLILLFLSFSIFITACTTIGKSLASIATTVDHAMIAWGQYVRDGKATDSEQVKIKALYVKYQSAMKVAQDGYNAGLTKINTTMVQQFATDLLTSLKTINPSIQ